MKLEGQLAALAIAAVGAWGLADCSTDNGTPAFGDAGPDSTVSNSGHPVDSGLDANMMDSAIADAGVDNAASDSGGDDGGDAGGLDSGALDAGGGDGCVDCDGSACCVPLTCRVVGGCESCLGIFESCFGNSDCCSRICSDAGLCQ
jgi:hypothetical protein